MKARAFPAGRCCSGSPAPQVATEATDPQVVSNAGSLRSWNDGPAKQTILNFIRITTDKSNPNFVPEEDRIATFDQDGTLWTEHPLYTQAEFMRSRMRDLAPQHPEWQGNASFKAILAGDFEARRIPAKRIGRRSRMQRAAG